MMTRRDWNYYSEAIWRAYAQSNAALSPVESARDPMPPTAPASSPTPEALPETAIIDDEETMTSRIQLTFNKQPLLADREMDMGQILILYFPHDTPLPTSSATWRKELAAAGYTLESYGRVPPGRFLEPYHEGYVEVRARKARS